MCKITRISAGSNCYLVTQKDAAILVDTGVKGFEKKILSQCEGKQVKLIVLTHGHIDHVQNAAFLAKQLQAPIAMNEKDIPLLKDNLCREMKSRGAFGGVVRFFSVQSAKTTQLEDFKPNILLKEGDTLEEYGIEAKVVELPGHTAGSIGLRVGADSLLVGDALMNMVKPENTLLFEDYEETVKSAGKIEKMGDLKIYFGHGKMVKNRKWVKEDA